MLDGKLTVQALPVTVPGQHCFALSGIVDVDADTLLQELNEAPAPGSRVELNFVGVQRVNSMGLAQLLKLFEHWQQRQIEIRISHANRMISVLFKMTGLAHLLTGSSTSNITPQQASATTANTQAPAVKTAPSVPARSNPISNIEHQAAAPAAAPASALPRPAPLLAQAGAAHSQQPPRQTGNPPTSNKLKFWVSVQNSQQMQGWFFFNTYLQRQLGRDIHMELLHGTNQNKLLHELEVDIAFCKPFEAVRQLLSQQFLPIAYPIGQSDEVTLLARADDPRVDLRQFQGGKVVTASNSNFVYLLGRFLLEEDEASLTDLDYQFLGCDIKTLQALIRGQADIAFYLSQSYQGLSGLTKSKLRILDQSETQFACHLFTIAPEYSDLAPVIENILLDMTRNSQGRQILQDLGLSGWAKPARDEIDMLTQLYQRYRLP